MIKTFRPDDESFEAMAVGNRKADLARDAAYAHALVMAMGEWDKKEWWSEDDVIRYIKKRSAEIMAEWGYPDE